MVVARSWGEEGMGSYCLMITCTNWYKVSVWEDEKVLEIDGGDIYTKM